MDLSSLAIGLIIGAVAGWLASILMGSKGGLIRNVIMGIAGGFVGNFIFSFLKISLPFPALVNSIAIAAVGACVIILIGQLLFK